MTGDIDIWVRPTSENATRVWQALTAYRAPLSKLTAQDFATPDLMYQIGVAPNRIDILTSIDGVGFDEAWASRTPKQIAGLTLNVLAPYLLLRNKIATGRPKDGYDAAWIQRKIDTGELPAGP